MGAFILLRLAQGSPCVHLHTGHEEWQVREVTSQCCLLSDIWRETVTHTVGLRCVVPYVPQWEEGNIVDVGSVGFGHLSGDPGSPAGASQAVPWRNGCWISAVA